MLIIKALKVILALICSSYVRFLVIFYCSFKGNNLMVFGGLLKSHDTLLNVHNLFKYNVNSVKQALGYGERQRSLACSRPWGHKAPDTTESLNSSSEAGPTLRHYARYCKCSSVPSPFPFFR